MRRKAQQGTEKIQRTLRDRSLRIGVGLAVLFAFGLMASGAFRDTFSVVGTTETDTTTSSGASNNDTISTPSPDTSSTDASSSSTSTDSSAPAPGSVPYIATFKSGVSDAQQQA